MCGIYAGVKPAWSGPPFVNGEPTLYSHQGVEEYNDFNDRLRWVDNRRILRLEPVFRNDTGVYSCSLTGVGNWTVCLNVRGKVFVEKIVCCPLEMNNFKPCTISVSLQFVRFLQLSRTVILIPI